MKSSSKSRTRAAAGWCHPASIRRRERREKAPDAFAWFDGAAWAGPTCDVAAGKAADYASVGATPAKAEEASNLVFGSVYE
eukprot:SAG11_NODE_5921_length_1432_cov_2.393848_1_plen_81_part_10